MTPKSQPTLPSGADAAARRDEGWFDRHPKRYFRLRRSYPNEWPQERATWTLAARLEPGVIVRSNFDSDEAPKNTDIMGEALWQRWGNDPLHPVYGPQVALLRSEPRP